MKKPMTIKTSISEETITELLFCIEENSVPLEWYEENHLAICGQKPYQRKCVEESVCPYQKIHQGVQYCSIDYQNLKNNVKEEYNEKIYS